MQQNIVELTRGKMIWEEKCKEMQRKYAKTKQNEIKRKVQKCKLAFLFFMFFLHISLVDGHQAQVLKT